MINLRSEIEPLREQLVAWRRDFHMHPELAYEERRTAGVVTAHLERLGYRVRSGVAETGVIGVLKGAQPEPVIMFRFDMDALPVTEETDLPYASQTPGRMHACGHDSHIAIGMGLAELLGAHRAELQGTAVLLFQPAEEGGKGAERMIQEGALNDPRPDVFIALHVWSDMPVGTADVTPGPVMAAADKWFCTIRGQGGHGAMPHQAADPIVAAAEVVSALQSVVSRNVSPLDTAVVTVGAIQGGDAFNVIPETVLLKGTIRSYLPATRAVVLRRVREVVEGVAAACGTVAELTIDSISPAVINTPQVAEVVRQAAEAVLGAARVSSGERTMGSEDAAFFLEQVPGCYFFIGATPVGATPVPHHNPHFCIDEGVLTIGLALMAEVASAYLLR